MVQTVKVSSDTVKAVVLRAIFIGGERVERGEVVTLSNQQYTELASAGKVARDTAAVEASAAAAPVSEAAATPAVKRAPQTKKAAE